MSVALRILLAILVLSILSLAFLRFASDEEAEGLATASSALLQDSGEEPAEFRRHQTESEGLEMAADEPSDISDPGASLIKGTINIEVKDRPEEKIKAGQIEMRVLVSEGQMNERLVDFQDDSFELEFGTDLCAVFVDALVVDGLRGNIIMEEPWYGRHEIETEGLHLQLKFGQLRRVEVLDATTSEALPTAAAYARSPVYVRDLDRSTQEPKPIVEGTPPLIWRDSPKVGSTSFVAARGFVPVGLGPQDKSVSLEKAGRLDLSIEAPWEAMKAQKHDVWLNIKEAENVDDSSSGDTVVRKKLGNSDQRRLIVDSLKPGRLTVTIEVHGIGVVSKRFVDIRKNATTRLEFKAELARLAKLPHDVTIFVSGAPKTVQWIPPSATLTPSLNGRLLCDEACKAVNCSVKEDENADSAVWTVHFGKKFPGDYELRVGNESFRLHVPDENLGPMSLELTQRPGLELRILDESGKPLDDQDVALMGGSLGFLEYSPERGCFLVPAVCESIQVHRRGASRDARSQHVSISMDVFKGRSRAEFIVPD